MIKVNSTTKIDEITGDIVKVTRQDTFRLDAEQKFKVTDQGFLICSASVTRAGVFVYHDAAGKEIRELRHPNEVFNQDSLDSLKLIPLTNQHPSVLVNSRNIKDYQVGTTGEIVKRKDEFVETTIVVTDSQMVQEIQQRHSDGESIELSCGYDADTIFIAGIHDVDGPFDAVQRNIVYNHVSIVDKGRAGRQVKLKLDKEETKMKIKSKSLVAGLFKMDAATLEVHEDSASVVENLLDKLDEAVGVINKMGIDFSKKNDGLQAKLDQATSDLDKAKKDSEGMIKADSVAALVEERISVIDIAKKLKVDTDGKDTKQIKVDIISASDTDWKADGKSDDYIQARFDAIVGAIKNDNSGLGDINKNLNLKKKDDDNAPVDHRKTFIDKSDNLHKDGE